MYENTVVGGLSGKVQLSKNDPTRFQLDHFYCYNSFLTHVFSNLVCYTVLILLVFNRFLNAVK